ncbi:hypothetical protein DM02DRAFT_387415 [Periconia macrospinosa]|uniref:C2H2-type domain-containing protein n=1 Tax=Periconia macrospinosa TaxID=97972 RepID=A0A2V1DQW2_9PLEO|nr:hypothetical protein DM02DRAFT_387415 [Periconia macrospinosa]
MISQLREAILALGLKDQSTRIPQKASPLGDPVGRCGRSKLCWEVKGEPKDLYERTIESQITRYLNKHFKTIPGNDRVTLSLYMVGDRPENAVPTIVFISKSSQTRKEARKAMKDCSVLSRYPEFRAEYVRKDPGCDQIEELASSEVPAIDQQIATEVLFDASEQASVLGQKIYISHPDSLRPATGNVIRRGDRIFYKTVFHAFRGSASKDKTLDSTEDENYESDSSDSEDEIDEAELAIMSIGSRSPDTWSNGASLSSGSSRRSSIFSGSSTPKARNTAAAHDDIRTTLEDANARLAPFAFTRRRFLASEPLVLPARASLSPLGTLVHWSLEHDWALIEILDPIAKEHLLFSAHDVSQTFAYDQVSAHPKADAEVFAVTATGGRLEGQLSNTPTSMRLPNSNQFKKVHIVRLNGPLANGACGSTVIDANTGVTYGHLVAGCKRTGTAYILAGHQIIADLEAIFENTTMANYVPNDRLVNTSASSSSSPSIQLAKSGAPKDILPSHLRSRYVWGQFLEDMLAVAMNCTLTLIVNCIAASMFETSQETYEYNYTTWEFPSGTEYAFAIPTRSKTRPLFHIVVFLSVQLATWACCLPATFIIRKLLNINLPLRRNRLAYRVMVLLIDVHFAWNVAQISDRLSLRHIVFSLVYPVSLVSFLCTIPLSILCYRRVKRLVSIVKITVLVALVIGFVLVCWSESSHHNVKSPQKEKTHSELLEVDWKKPLGAVWKVLPSALPQRSQLIALALCPAILASRIYVLLGRTIDPVGYMSRRLSRLDIIEALVTIGDYSIGIVGLVLPSVVSAVIGTVLWSASPSATAAIFVGAFIASSCVSTITELVTFRPYNLRIAFVLQHIAHRTWSVLCRKPESEVLKYSLAIFSILHQMSDTVWPDLLSPISHLASPMCLCIDIWVTLLIFTCCFPRRPMATNLRSAHREKSWTSGDNHCSSHIVREFEQNDENVQIRYPSSSTDAATTLQIYPRDREHSYDAAAVHDTFVLWSSIIGFLLFSSCSTGFSATQYGASVGYIFMTSILTLHLFGVGLSKAILWLWTRRNGVGASLIAALRGLLWALHLEPDAPLICFVVMQAGISTSTSFAFGSIYLLLSYTAHHDWHSQISQLRPLNSPAGIVCMTGAGSFLVFTIVDRLCCSTMIDFCIRPRNFLGLLVGYSIGALVIACITLLVLSHVRSRHSRQLVKIKRRVPMPHVVIKIPVYKESLAGVIRPTIRSLKAAMETYERRGGTASIFIGDDSLRHMISRQQTYDENLESPTNSLYEEGLVDRRHIAPLSISSNHLSADAVMGLNEFLIRETENWKRKYHITDLVGEGMNTSKFSLDDKPYELISSSNELIDGTSLSVDESPYVVSAPPSMVDQNSQLVIGLDFGMTYSGVAYANHLHDDLSSIATIRNWPKVVAPVPESAERILPFCRREPLSSFREPFRILLVDSGYATNGLHEEDRAETSDSVHSLQPHQVGRRRASDKAGHVLINDRRHRLQRREQRNNTCVKQPSHSRRPDPPSPNEGRQMTPSKITSTEAHNSWTARTSKAKKGLEVHECVHCERSYSRLVYLRRHEKSHEETPLQCKFCNKTFNRLDLFQRHKERHKEMSVPLSSPILSYSPLRNTPLVPAPPKDSRSMHFRNLLHALSSMPVSPKYPAWVTDDFLRPSRIDVTDTSRDRNMPLVLGPIKSTVGHGECVSGTSALIKVLLMMKRKPMPLDARIKARRDNFSVNRTNGLNHRARAQIDDLVERLSLLNACDKWLISGFESRDGSPSAPLETLRKYLASRESTSFTTGVSNLPSQDLYDEHGRSLREILQLLEKLKKSQSIGDTHFPEARQPQWKDQAHRLIHREQSKLHLLMSTFQAQMVSPIISKTFQPIEDGSSSLGNVTSQNGTRYYCTTCPSGLRGKYEWKRHEAGDESRLTSPKVWARGAATSAAPFYFMEILTPKSDGEKSFLDGGLRSSLPLHDNAMAEVSSWVPGIPGGGNTHLARQYVTQNRRLLDVQDTYLAMEMDGNEDFWSMDNLLWRLFYNRLQQISDHSDVGTVEGEFLQEDAAGTPWNTLVTDGIPRSRTGKVEAEEIVDDEDETELGRVRRNMLGVMKISVTGEGGIDRLGSS